MLKDREVKHHNSISYGKLKNFELRELKLFFALMTDIKNEKLEYHYSAKSIKKFINMGDQSYKTFEKLIGDLQERRILIPVNDTTYESYSIFSVLRFDRLEKTIDVEYNYRFFPFISDLKKNFCKYKLKNIESLSSKYSIIFYIRGKADLFKGKFYISFDEILQISKKNKYRPDTVDRYILNPALEEINKFTDLNISVEKMYQAQQRGRSKLVGYTFHVSKKEIMVSDELRAAVEKAKKNIYISKSKVLNTKTIQILLDDIAEENLIPGLKYAYKKINKEFNTLEYLKRIILSNKEKEEVIEKIGIIEDNSLNEEPIENIDILEKLKNLAEYERLKAEEKAIKLLCEHERIEEMYVLSLKDKCPKMYWGMIKKYITYDIP